MLKAGCIKSGIGSTYFALKDIDNINLEYINLSTSYSIYQKKENEINQIKKLNIDDFKKEVDILYINFDVSTINGDSFRSRIKSEGKDDDKLGIHIEWNEDIIFLMKNLKYKNFIAEVTSEIYENGGIITLYNILEFMTRRGFKIAYRKTHIGNYGHPIFGYRYYIIGTKENINLDNVLFKDPEGETPVKKTLDGMVMDKNGLRNLYRNIPHRRDKVFNSHYFPTIIKDEKEKIAPVNIETFKNKKGIPKGVKVGLRTLSCKEYSKLYGVPFAISDEFESSRYGLDVFINNEKFMPAIKHFTKLMIEEIKKSRA